MFRLKYEFVVYSAKFYTKDDIFTRFLLVYSTPVQITKVKEMFERNVSIQSLCSAYNMDHSYSQHRF